MNKVTLIRRSLWVEVLVNKVMVGCCSLNWAIREMFYVTTLRMKKLIVVFIYFGFKATNFSVSQSNVFYGFSCFCCRFPFLLKTKYPGMVQKSVLWKTNVNFCFTCQFIFYLFIYLTCFLAVLRNLILLCFCFAFNNNTTQYSMRVKNTNTKQPIRYLSLDLT